MEYGQRRALERDDDSENTTMTTRSVRDILAEQGQAHLLDTASFVPASEAPTVPPRPMYGAFTAAAAYACLRAPDDIRCCGTGMPLRGAVGTTIVSVPPDRALDPPPPNSKRTRP